MADEALAEYIAAIAKDVREIRDDLRWFREREERKPQVLKDVAAEEVNRLVVSRQ
jgi:hypothetical protein